MSYVTPGSADLEDSAEPDELSLRIKAFLPPDETTSGGAQGEGIDA
ncbi:MAG: hypothetical protein AAGF15_05575 [Pseudomonadota bacterium]